MRKKLFVLLVVSSCFLGAALGYVSWVGPEKVIDWINETVKMLSESI